jgi:hypothetical protein
VGNPQLDQLEREFVRIVGRLRRLEELSVPTAARLLKKTPKWVRGNFPVIIHGPKSHHVRLYDIEKYRRRRTVWTRNGKDAG